MSHLFKIGVYYNIWGSRSDSVAQQSDSGGIGFFYERVWFDLFPVLVEIKWLMKLSKIPQVTEVASFTKDAEVYLQGIIDGFSIDDALEVKKIERVPEFFHFACTSRDINNLSNGLMLQEALTSVILPTMDELIKSISLMAKEFAYVPMLSRTHGQPASPTTLGKEMAIFAEFVTSVGLTFNPYVTQIEPHDYMARLFNTISQFNNILIDFDREIYRATYLYATLSR
ncbi:unnamed protein product [Microthlaspi erraticum]|uniref:Fumarate lyase N-terminal domain-containing protein n=1 Tax=Microthlaspi erraticum TaxID=1685480 RepID=A0A6D2HWU2_9BRAS|nr:unnamed protein product [Microthlaspi erraticum]